MSKYCGQCGLLDKKNKRNYYDEYYCIDKHNYHSLNDRKAERCNSFIFDPNAGKSSGKNSFKPSGLFYIVTIVNKILNLGPDDEVFKILYEAGNKLKNSNNELKDIIFDEYNISGCTIAEKINKMDNREEFAKMLYNKYLLPISNELKDNKEENALKEYLQMVDKLKKDTDTEGIIDLAYISNVALLYPDDLLHRTVCDVLSLNNSESLDILSDYIIKDADEDVVLLYNEISILLTDIAYSIDDLTARSNFIKKYYNSYIKLFVTDIKNCKNNTADLNNEMKRNFKNMIFYINAENSSKIFNAEKDVVRNLAIKSNR